MGTRNNPGVYDCLGTLDPDEPFFVLKGRDPHAADLVRLWAHERRSYISAGIKPAEDEAKVKEALACAVEMDAYREEREARAAALRRVAP